MEIFDDQYSGDGGAWESLYRQFGELEVHEDLIEAQKKGNLVIFAGAGVSAGPRSCLPTFEGLIQELEEWSGYRRERDTVKDDGEEVEKPVEPFEEYLGRLEDQKGVDLRPKVREIIGRKDSEPTDLHHTLLQLFDSPEEVKIVTTNFDLHFSTAAQEGVDEFAAPALPKGDDFSGIVYLHGNLSQANRRLVLSDKDFSRAYLTEGWARRFLQQLFSEYVVLFVGYGHGDDVMRYLARGVPPDRDEGRFAFEAEGDDSIDWDHYGVAVKRFPKVEGEDPYAELPRGIQEWVDRTAGLSPSEQEARIERILQKQPDTLLRPELEELDVVLREDNQIHFFTNHANSLEWVEWTLREGYLDPLLEPGEASGRLKALASWLADQVASAPDHLLALLTGGHRRWNSVLTDKIVAVLYSAWKEELDSDTVTKWIRVVLQNAGKSFPNRLSSMLGDCRYPEDRYLAVLLFDFLTRPKVNVRTGELLMPEEGASTTSADVHFSGGENPPTTTFIREAWKDLFLPNLDDLAPEMERILTERLRDFHSAYFEHSGSYTSDPISHQWERVLFDENERVADERYVLLTCGKELVDRLIQEMPERANNVIDQWACSNVPILEVLATYGVGADSRRTAEEKVGWVLDRGWLLSRRTEGEPGRVIIDAYSECSTEVQEDVLERVREREGTFSEEDHTGRLRMTRKLLVNLSNMGLDDGQASSLLEAFDERNPDLQERPVATALSTEARNHILRPELDPEEDLEEIRDLFSGESEPWQRHELERQLEQVLRDDPNWGIEVGRHLAKDEVWDDEAWPYLFRVYRRIDMEADEWESLLDLCHSNTPLHDRYGEKILLTAIYAVNHPGHSFPEALLDEAIGLVDTLWSFPQYDEYGGEKERRDWFRDHTHTKTVRFYYRVFVERGRQNGISESFQSRMEGMLEDGTDPVPSITAFALARRAAQLFERDREWGRETIVPLFNWSDEKKISSAAWTGAVSLQQLSAALIQELRDDFQETFRQMEEWLDSSSRKELVQMVGRICAFGVVDPLEKDWLDSFTTAASPDERASWARTVRSTLSDNLSQDLGEHAWGEWVERYIHQRCVGIPMPVQPQEGLEIMRWIPHLASNYSDGVQLILECDPPAGGDGRTDFTLQIDRNDLASKQPEATLDFLNYLLDRNIIHCWGLSQLLPVLAQQDVSRTNLDSLFEKAISHGCIDRAFKEEHLALGE